MIIGDNYVFSRNRRCASTAICNLLKNHYGGTQIFNAGKYQHRPIQDIIHTEHKDKFKFTCIRNPWDWYRSHYEYIKNFPNSEFSTKLTALGADTTSFKGYTLALLRLPTYYPTFLDYWLSHPRNGLGMSMEEIRAVPYGFATICYLIQSCDLLAATLWGRDNPTCNSIVDQTIMIEEMPEALDQAIFRIKEGILTEHDRLLVRNAHENSYAGINHYSQFYTDELIELVAQKDKYIIQKFGYTFDDRRT